MVFEGTDEWPGTPMRAKAFVMLDFGQIYIGVYQKVVMYVLCGNYL